MDPSVDIAVVSQDPRIGGGFRSSAERFFEAALALGRKPHLFYLSRGHQLSLVRRSIHTRARYERHNPPLEGTSIPSVLPEMDAINQVVAGQRIARRVRSARSVWVVATTASYGVPALYSRRPYGVWLGTSLESEWRARRHGLRPSRKLALALNAPFLRRLERSVIRGAALVCATSTASHAMIAAAGEIPEEQVRVLPIPLDVRRFAPESEEDWLRRLERPVIAFIGRANDPRKNLGLLLEALPGIRARIPGARVRLIGERPYPRLARLLGAEDEVLGVLRDPDVPVALRTATLFVLPSRQEGFGIVVAEALASGVPALVTPCRGPEELIRESAGGLVLGGFDPEELAERAAELLGDPSRLLEMRRRGREYVAREHSPARFRERVALAFEELDAVG